MNNLSEANEQIELNKILQSLLQVNGSLKRLNIETDEMFITLPKLDWKYIVKVIQQNKQGKVYKFFSIGENNTYVKLGNIKVVCGGTQQVERGL